MKRTILTTCAALLLAPSALADLQQDIAAADARARKFCTELQYLGMKYLPPDQVQGPNSQALEYESYFAKALCEAMFEAQREQVYNKRLRGQ